MKPARTPSARWQRIALCLGLLLSAVAQAQPARVRIVALGDSYSSGEGAPDVQRAGRDPAQWNAGAKGQDDSRMRTSNRICHRSNNAWPRQVADAFEQRSGRTVDFISFACSGAQIPDLVEKEQVRDGTPSDVGPASRCTGLDPLLGQLCEVERHFTQGASAGQTIDALVFTIGGNDVGFAPAIMTCASPTNCADPVIHTPLGDKAQPVWPEFQGDIEAGKRKLRERFTLLSQRIEEINARYIATYKRLLIQNVFALEYPNAFRNERGELCGLAAPDPRNPGASTLPPDPDPLDLITTRELRWGDEQVMPALNGTVRECIARMGLPCDPNQPAPVPGEGGYGFFASGSGSAFRNHGFCATAGERWIVKLREAVSNQGDPWGAVHPNARGHQALRDVMLPELDRLVPPGSLQVNLGPQAPSTAFTPGGLRFVLNNVDGRARFLQLALRPATDRPGRSGLDAPPQHPATSLATPPRYPAVQPGQPWAIQRTQAQTTWTGPRPEQATDYAWRACTEAACSNWSDPVRVVVVDGFTRPPAIQQLRASIAGRNGTAVTLRLSWQATDAAPNRFVELGVPATGSAAERVLSERDAGSSTTLLQVPATLRSLSARQCQWALVSGQARSGRSCSAWSAAVSVPSGMDRRNPSGPPAERRTTTPRDPSELRLPGPR